MGRRESCCQRRGLEAASGIGFGEWNFLGQVRLPDSVVNLRRAVSMWGGYARPGTDPGVGANVESLRRHVCAFTLVRNVSQGQMQNC